MRERGLFMGGEKEEPTPADTVPVPEPTPEDGNGI
jgi:hypothetical protein